MTSTQPDASDEPAAPSERQPPTGQARDRPRALVTAPLRSPALERLGQLVDLVLDPWIDHEPLRIYDGEALARRAREIGATILVVEADYCQGPVFDLPLIAVASTRGDPKNVDVVAATRAGVPVLFTPGRNADAVAEMTIALLLAATRHVVVADREVRAGQIYRDGTIPYQRMRSFEIAGRTAGLVGLGAVGRATSWRMRGLGLNVQAYDPYQDDAESSLEELLSTSDIISMHAPLTDATRGMIGPEQFTTMKDGAIYLNTARAELHDGEALVKALSSGKLASAALDHFPGENLAPDDPLASFQNVVLTPHIGGATYDTETRQTSMVTMDLERLLSGERPLHCMNPEVLQ